MKTPEEMAEEFAATETNHIFYRKPLSSAFLAGYKAAENHFRDATKKVGPQWITYDYVETASNEAKELIAEFGLKGDENMLVKALVAAYCSGVDAVDGYLRNSLSAYRASVKSQQWISVKDRLPKVLESILVLYAPTNEPKNDYRMECWNWPETDVYETKFITHWMPLPEAPKEEE